MPAGAIHLCVAKLVASKLNIDKTMDFYVGTISPDSWRNSTSTKIGTHFIEQEDSFEYNYDYFYQKYSDKLNNKFVFGYLIHLITDKYWHLNNFLATRIKSEEYPEFHKACSFLIYQYDISRLELPINLENIIFELDLSGVQKTINYLNDVNYLDDKNSIFDINELQLRIEETATYVISELNRLQKLRKL